MAKEKKAAAAPKTALQRKVLAAAKKLFKASEKEVTKKVITHSMTWQEAQHKAAKEIAKTQPAAAKKPATKAKPAAKK